MSIRNRELYLWFHVSFTFLFYSNGRHLTVVQRQYNVFLMAILVIFVMAVAVFREGRTRNMIRHTLNLI